MNIYNLSLFIKNKQNNKEISFDILGHKFKEISELNICCDVCGMFFYFTGNYSYFEFGFDKKYNGFFLVDINNLLPTCDEIMIKNIIG